MPLDSGHSSVTTVLQEVATVESQSHWDTTSSGQHGFVRGLPISSSGRKEGCGGSQERGTHGGNSGGHRSHGQAKATDPRGPPHRNPRLGRLTSLESRSENRGPRRTKRRRRSRARSRPHPAGQTSSSGAQSWWGRGYSGVRTLTAWSGKEKPRGGRPADRWRLLSLDQLPLPSKVSQASPLALHAGGQP